MMLLPADDVDLKLGHIFYSFSEFKRNNWANDHCKRTTILIGKNKLRNINLLLKLCAKTVQ